MLGVLGGGEGGEGGEGVTDRVGRGLLEFADIVRRHQPLRHLFPSLVSECVCVCEDRLD